MNSLSSVSLSTGEFVLSSSDGRNSSGSVRDCRVLSPTGIAITYLSDVIKDLNERYLNVAYIASNYNVTEWEEEELSLASSGDGGVVFNTEIKLYEAIRQLMDGAIVGFRYEILPDGRRTIRIDDNSRALFGIVTPEDIQNRNEMPVSTDSDQVFQKVIIKHSKSWNSDRYLREENSDYSAQVIAEYSSFSVLTKDTFLNSSVDAAIKGADLAERFSVIPKLITLILKGKEFFGLRIYDRMPVQATPDFVDADTDTIIGREYYGLKNGKVLSIVPDLDNRQTEVVFQLQEV